MLTSESEICHDVVVIGAGPAGLAAAVIAADHGATIALVDAGHAPGGQYWRQRAAGAQHERDDHTPYAAWMRRLREHESQGRVSYHPRHEVWALEREASGFVVHAIDRVEDRVRTVRGRRLVMATGAYDRQVPFPGWTLPGVITAGGAQALLKGHGVPAGRRIVVAGTGPFLLPVAAALAESGSTVLGVHEAASPLAWLRHGPTLAHHLAKVGEGLSYAARLARHWVPIHIRSVVLSAHGHHELESVTVARVDSRERIVPGSVRHLQCDTLAVGWGFTPQLELPLALGCATRIDADGSLTCVVDEQQRTTVDGVYVAGETSGVGGADLALVEGIIAGSAAASVPTHDPLLHRRRRSLRRFAHAMHDAHPLPTGWMERVESDTIVCRCEEVTAGQLRSVVDELGATDIRTAKLLARVGMGWCQGRVCGHGASCLTSWWAGTPTRPEGIASRPIATPVRLGSLLHQTPPEIRPLMSEEEVQP